MTGRVVRATAVVFVVAVLATVAGGRPEHARRDFGHDRPGHDSALFDNGEATSFAPDAITPRLMTTRHVIGQPDPRGRSSLPFAGVVPAGALLMFALLVAGWAGAWIGRADLDPPTSPAVSRGPPVLA